MTPSARRPVSRTPTTSGIRSVAGSPSMTSSASSPPIPQPSTPIPPTIGVWLSVPSMTSGRSTSPTTVLTVASCSRLIVCMIPVPGGLSRTLGIAAAAHLRKAKRSPPRRSSVASLCSRASGVANVSTAIEWSTDTSTGRTGERRAGSAPASARTSRIAAMSTRAGVLVVSCMRSRSGVKSTSADEVPARSQPRNAVSAASRSSAGAQRATLSARSRRTCGRRTTSSPSSTERSRNAYSRRRGGGSPSGRQGCSPHKDGRL